MKQRASIANNIILLILLLIIPQVVGAQNLHLYQNPELYTLLLKVQHQASEKKERLGEVNIEAYVSALSECDDQGFVGSQLSHLLPFQTSFKKDIAFEAIVQASYRWPGGMKFSCKTINTSNKRKSRSMLKDYYQTFLPGFEIREADENSSGKFHVLPFSQEGLDNYRYRFVDMNDYIRNDFGQMGVEIDSSICIVSFEPIRKHHTMLSGILVIDSTKYEVIGFEAEGRIDLAKFETRVLFRPDSTLHQILPYLSETKIHYHYAGTRGTNTFNTLYKYKSMHTLDEVKAIRPRNYNLTSTYETLDMDEADFDTIRPILLSPRVDSILYTPEVVEPRQHNKKPAIFTFSEHMVEGGRFGDENNRLRLYGPLDPATFAYDRINGFSLNERMRWNVVFRDESTFNFSAKLGYAFKINELRYQLRADWTFLPKIRQGLTASFERSNTGFSNKYIEQINEALKQKKDTIDFYGLGIDYFQHYELRMEHHTEIFTGLNIFTGLQYNYRRPVKHGKMASSAEHREELATQHFSDFAPFIRLEWTPRQYYYFEGRRKIYIDGNTPTFILEATKAIPGVWGANSNYGRVEFDVSQNIPAGSKRHIAYRLGTGAFFHQDGEYFINYHYFKRNFYPTTWLDNKIGGTFQLLDEHWFSSSPSYMRAHLMFETPYGLIHKTFKSLSKYVIKERTYLSLLSAEGKKFYSELGYGFANNYFNIGVFIGFRDTDIYKVGAKVRIELGDHF